MLVRRGDGVDIVRVAPLPVSQTDSLKLARRYDRYFNDNGVRRLNIWSDPTAVTDSTGLLSVAGKRIALIGGGKVESLPGRLDFLIITEGFRDSVVWLARAGVADRILVGSDVSKIRALRHVRELREAGMESWWLGDTPLHLASD